jgi:hypothetical protein
VTQPVRIPITDSLPRGGQWAGLVARHLVATVDGAGTFGPFFDACRWYVQVQTLIDGLIGPEPDRSTADVGFLGYAKVVHQIALEQEQEWEREQEQKQEQKREQKQSEPRALSAGTARGRRTSAGQAAESYLATVEAARLSGLSPRDLISATIEAMVRATDDLKMIAIATGLPIAVLEDYQHAARQNPKKKEHDLAVETSDSAVISDGVSATPDTADASLEAERPNGEIPRNLRGESLRGRDLLEDRPYIQRDHVFISQRVRYPRGQNVSGSIDGDDLSKNSLIRAFLKGERLARLVRGRQGSLGTLDGLSLLARETVHALSGQEATAKALVSIDDLHVDQATLEVHVSANLGRASLYLALRLSLGDTRATLSAQCQSFADGHFSDIGPQHRIIDLSDFMTDQTGDVCAQLTAALHQIVARVQEVV